jgi:hypothetical protein
MIADWKKEIAIAMYVQNEIEKLDTQGIWEYFLPRVAATEEELARLEAVLGRPLDPCYRRFLVFADGWRCFHQNVDLFGTEELSGSPKMAAARLMLEHIATESLSGSGLMGANLFPIAASSTDLDLFVIVPVDGAGHGPVIWLAGYEVQRFPNFDEFFLAMVDYNRLRLEKFRRGEMRITT